MQDADQSWTWSADQKGESEWTTVTKKKKRTSSVVDGESSVAPADDSAPKGHRTFLEVVLGDGRTQPTRHSELERQKLAAEKTSRIEKLERLIAMVGDDESMAGHKASLERDLAAARRQAIHSPLQLKSKRSQIGFLVKRPVSNSSLRTMKKAKTALEAQMAALQLEEERLVELRAELASALANMDVDTTEIAALERQELE